MSYVVNRGFNPFALTSSSSSSSSSSRIRAMKPTKRSIRRAFKRHPDTGQFYVQDEKIATAFFKEEISFARVVKLHSWLIDTLLKAGEGHILSQESHYSKNSKR